MEAVFHSRPIHHTDLPERDPRIGEMVRGLSVRRVEQAIIEGVPRARAGVRGFRTAKTKMSR